MFPDQQKDVSRAMHAQEPIAWLLLRDRHAVPIFGLAPDELKRSRAAAIEHPGAALKHLTGLNAVVDSLGFDGDFGDYVKEHWPRIQEVLAKHGCKERKDFFAWVTNDLAFRIRRRELADRYFLGPTPLPKRVFLGVGYPWDKWYSTEPEQPFREEPDVAPGAPLSKVRELVYAYRTDLSAFWNLIGDQLVEPATRGFVQQSYWTQDANADERAREEERQHKVCALFRRYIGSSPDGWVELIPLSRHLLLLKAPGGQYDLVWRALREEPPAKRPDKGRLVDQPSFLQEQSLLDQRLYFDRDLWTERDVHEAELRYYRLGGRAGMHYPGLGELLRRYHHAREAPRRAFSSVAKASPLRLLPVEVEGKILAVSDLITISELRRFLKESGYARRRRGDNLERANPDADQELPACATFDDALAYCAHLEHQLGAPVRLLTFSEHRAIRPNQARELERKLSRAELLKVKFPGAVSFDWTSADKEKDHTPVAKWSDPLPMATYRGLRFIDAYNAAEWTITRDHNAAVTVNWEGDLPHDSWGGYKRLKTCFRVVVDVAPDA